MGPVEPSSGPDAIAGGGDGIVWYRTMGQSDNQLARAVALDATGGRMAVAGLYGLEVDFGNGVKMAPDDDKYAFFVVTYTSDGQALWGRSLRHNYAQPSAMGLAFAPSGALVMTSTSPAFDVQIDCETITGGAFVAAFGADGNVLWAREPGGGEGHSVAVDASGDVLVTGTFNGSIQWPGCAALQATSAGDVFAAKLGGVSGVCLWSKALGTTGGIGRGAAVDASGDVFVTGQFGGTLTAGGACNAVSAGDPDAFVAKLRGSDGACLWATGHGDGDEQRGYGVAVDGQDIVVAGSFVGAVSFGGHTVSATSADTYVAKLGGADGSYRWVDALGFGDLISAPYPRGLGLAIGAQHQVVVTGSRADDFCTLNCRDLFIERRGADGAYVSTTVFGDSFQGLSDQIAYGVAANDGGVYIAGGFNVVGQLGPLGAELGPVGGYDILVVKLDP